MTGEVLTKKVEKLIKEYKLSGMSLREFIDLELDLIEFENSIREDTYNRKRGKR